MQSSKNGTFLVRSKEDKKNVCHVVSVVYNGAPVHLLVDRDTVEDPFKVNGETFGQVGILLLMFASCIKHVYAMIFVRDSFLSNRSFLVLFCQRRC